MRRFRDKEAARCKNYFRLAFIKYREFLRKFLRGCRRDSEGEWIRDSVPLASVEQKRLRGNWKSRVSRLHDVSSLVAIKTLLLPTKPTPRWITSRLFSPLQTHARCVSSLCGALAVHVLLLTSTQWHNISKVQRSSTRWSPVKFRASREGIEPTLSLFQNDVIGRANAIRFKFNA